MRILVSEFRQESNSFTPVPSTMEFWKQNGIYEGDEVRDAFVDKPCAVGGMIQALEGAPGRPEVVYGVTMSCQSGGKAEQDVMDFYLDRLLEQIEQHAPLDGVFLSFHGALQTTEHADPEAEIARRVRAVVGDACVIAASTDLHAYISRELVDAVNIVCAYHTYPHVDYVETGYRAASLGLRAIEQELAPVMAWAPVPMIVSASSYNTNEGAFRDLMAHGQSLVDRGDLLDFSIYQMQPWLDIPDGHSTILTIAAEAEEAKRHAQHLAERLYAARHQFVTDLMSIDEVIDRAEAVESSKPVILVDSADSCNAGAPGDSMAAAARILERRSPIRVATVVNDRDAARQAHQCGVGERAIFGVGGSRDPNAVRIEAEGYVKSLHDGVFTQEGPAGRGMVNRIGPTAVLAFGNLDVVVCQWMAGNGDPQLYRAFGVEPTLYDLVVVKANTSFRAAYGAFAGEICEADTPGSAAPVLNRLDFQHLPRNLYPWTDAATVDFPVRCAPVAAARTVH